MKHTIKHGATIDIPSLAEIAALLKAGPRVTYIRAAAAVVLDAAGNGLLGVYECPLGMEFEARRLALNLDSAADPSTGNVPLNVAGKSVAILRSGTLIEYANPQAPTGTAQVPGVMSWSSQQGPIIRNGEVLQLQAAGLTANTTFTVELAGILRQPGTSS